MMSYPLLTEKPLLGANFLPPQKSARERAAERWFNREKSPSTTTSTSDKTVSGQYYDEETGCHYNWNRYYCPAIGRYTTSDPIGLAGGLNTYLYANANPVMYVDPEGLNPAAVATIGFSVGGPPGAVVGGVLGTAIGVWLGYELFEDNASSSSDNAEQAEDCPPEGGDDDCVVVGMQSSKWPGVPEGFVKCIYKCKSSPGQLFPRYNPVSVGCPSPIGWVPGTVNPPS